MTIREALNISCREATALVEKKRSGKLLLTEHLGLLRHMAVCALCKMFAQQSALIDMHAKQVGSNNAHVLSPEAKDKLNKNLLEHMK